MKNIVNNVYGEYKEPYSWLLRENGKLVGACIMTIRNKGDTGYIPDIVIDPEYQGKGLGKTILIHSMKEILKGEPDIVKVDLDVTMENNARFLYISLGYEKIREYSMYTWINKKND
jgi:ribosomal protein S18 acetylase RimI-like enzyme